eukprot:jgi/Ulvmu1/10737/UM068_0025.1
MALTFCPNDGSLLQLDMGARATQLWCPACNYKYEVRRKISLKLPPKLKDVDDVLAQEEQWANAQKAEVRCGNCEHNEAYFLEIQIRSADEPATIFYRCTHCAARWRDD